MGSLLAFDVQLTGARPGPRVGLLFELVPVLGFVSRAASSFV